MLEAVEFFLRNGEQIDKLNTAIDALEDHKDVDRRDDYGRIVFRNTAYRYRLTDRAIALVNRDW